MLTRTLALAFASVAFAQKIIVVQVGPGGKLAYDPPTISAAVGDTVTLMYNPTNHTFTQSSFNTPCIALPGGLDTSFVPVPPGGMTQNRTITISSGEPMYFYCRQTGHCGKGMVAIINPTNDQEFAEFQAKAIAQNGTSTSSVAGATTTLAPSVTVATITTTVTLGSSTYTTTYTTSQGTPAPTSAANPTIHTVTVGANGALRYDPEVVNASIGDTVQFKFFAKNHTVTQSTFSQPCQSLQKSTGVLGFDSGFMPVSANATINPTFNITINDTNPIWIYCRQQNHCPSGMVLAVNPAASGNTFDAFQALALASNSSANSTANGTGTASPKSGAISTPITGVGLTAILAVVGVVALAL